MSKLDNYGYFGPDYSFADAIPLPNQVGVRQEASIGAIIDAVGGVNYYVDTIAFGGPSFFDTQNPQPMGVRYFLNTDMRCSNGATMSEYVDGVTKGDILGSHVAAALQSAGLPGLRGLAPGMLENARDALDPRPIFSAVTGTGYPVCQQVSCVVGDTNNLLADPQDPTKKYVLDPVEIIDGAPFFFQKRWVQAYDANGDRITVTKPEFAAQPKCYNADGSFKENPPAGCPAKEPDAQLVLMAGDPQYGSCYLRQSATMPPSLPAGSGTGPTESFAGSDGDPLEKWLAVAAVVAIGGVALWSLQRKR